MPVTWFCATVKRNGVKSFALEWAQAVANLRVFYKGKNLLLRFLGKKGEKNSLWGSLKNVLSFAQEAQCFQVMLRNRRRRVPPT